VRFQSIANKIADGADLAFNSLFVRFPYWLYIHSESDSILFQFSLREIQKRLSLRRKGRRYYHRFQFSLREIPQASSDSYNTSAHLPFNSLFVRFRTAEIRQHTGRQVSFQFSLREIQSLEDCDGLS